MRYANTRLAARFIACCSLTSAAVVKIGTQPKQTITSFGASGAWWPNDLIHFPEEVQENLTKLLFSEDGLHLSSYRYNVGGDGGNDTERVTTNGRAVESFLLRNGTYDWSRDSAGVKVLKAAQQYAVPYITYFVNAAPSNISDNGAACGWNMTAAKVPAFADYLATVLSYWTDHGIDIKYISPMNEPDNARPNCEQEGMAVQPSLRSSVIKAIRSALDGSDAEAVDIIADETSQVTTQAFPEDPVWLPSSTPYMSNIAVHNYDYPSDSNLTIYYQSLVNITDGHPPPVKYTETCCSTRSGSGSDVFGAQYDPTMGNALIVGRYVWQFLTIVQAQSFDWWTAVSSGLPCSPAIDGASCATELNNTSSAGYNDGLIYIDPQYNTTKDYSLYLTKRAFMLKHFATFHRPGSVRYDIAQSQLPDSVNAFASKSAASPSTYGPGSGAQTWSVLFMNNQTAPYKFTLAAPKGAKLKQLVQTTNEADWEVVQQLPVVRRGNVQLSLPAQSIVTVQFTA